MGRIGFELGNGQEPAALRLREVGQKQLSLRRTVQRQPRADLGHHTKACPALFLCQRHNGRAIKNGQEHGLSELRADFLHMRPRNRADIPGIGHRTAIFKQADPEPVAAVRHLLDETSLAHRGKKAVNRALRPARRLIKLGERGGLGALCEQVQKTDGLCHRMYRFAFKLCHNTDSFSFVLYSVSCFRFASKRFPFAIVEICSCTCISASCPCAHRAKRQNRAPACAKARWG